MARKSSYGRGGLRLILFILPLLLTACTGPAFGATRSQSAKHLKTVFVIMLENHNWQDIAASGQAPYLTRTLPKLAAQATQYYSPHDLHPSLPNYIWLEAGSNNGIWSDVPPSRAHLSTAHHLVTLLYHAHISWRAYEDGISGKSCPLYDSGAYATRHNPMIYFDDTTHRNNPRSRYCILHERPFTELPRDLKRNTVARYNFITPNLCHDMHDSCAPLHNAIRQGDTWLSQVVPVIQRSKAYKSGGVIFILWDEGSETSDAPMHALAISPFARAGSVITTRYTHSSTLRTIEEIFGLKEILGGARTSNDLRALFKSFP